MYGPVCASAAVVDIKFIPLGAAVAVDGPRRTGIWIAQDTGGAIKGKPC
jgi:3D (Asp-Asp-Asp) domain-containing protein